MLDDHNKQANFQTAYTKVSSAPTGQERAGQSERRGIVVQEVLNGQQLKQSISLKKRIFL